jgi:hypothetical protein
MGMLMTATTLFAGMSVTLYQDTANYSYGNGGEFRAVGNADLNNAVNWAAYSANTAVQGQYFQTFCIEDTEYFSPGVTYSASLNNNALYGVVGHSPGTPVTLGTAWLYSQFAAGALSTYGYNYVYGSGRADANNAGALQQALWYFQGEAVGVDNPWAELAKAALSGMGLSAWDAANGKWGVEALVLGDPGQVQDQLVIVPEPTTVIAGMGALGLLLFGAGVHNKRSVLRIGK